MLTAIIRARGSSPALAATFSVLIGAVADGFLGHAVVLDAEADPEVERLADRTGAALVRAAGRDGWSRAASAARGEWLLLLEAGEAPQPHWVQAAERQMMLAPGASALLPLAGALASLRERTQLRLAPLALRPGLLAPRAQVAAGRLAAPPRRLSVRRERLGY